MVDFIWYEGLYAVTRDGRVWSYPGWHKKWGWLNLYKVEYCRVNLCDKYHRRKRFVVHRMVATMYIPNPENKPFINHIDWNKYNNNDWNLEWCTASENLLHSFRILGRKHSEKHKAQLRAVAQTILNKPIWQYNFSWDLIQQFNSTMDAARSLNKFQAHIGACARGERKTAFWFIWKYI